MYKRFIMLVLFVWICNAGFSQDFKFRWHVRAFIGKSYTVLIERNNSKRYITIIEKGAADSVRLKMGKKDCDTLVSFLDEYDFPIKGNTIYGPKFRVDLVTKLLPDTNWILVKGDSIRRELLSTRGFYFDVVANTCYTYAQQVETCIDGDTYDGEYFKSNVKQTFSVHSCRISPMDYKLNNLMYKFICRYDGEKDYNLLKINIESDRPRRK